MRWGTQLERGYSTVIVAEIEGIPARWAERDLATMEDVAPAAVAGITTFPSLVITPAMSQSSDLDRQTGNANGRAIDIVIDMDQTAAAGLAFFRRPTLKTRLTEDVTNPASATIEVVSTTGWPSSGSFWLGREYVTYTSVTGTSFNGCTRGVAGYPWRHISNGASGYSYATNAPIYWRGRFVTLREYLVAPDGRMVGTSWTDATYSGVLWRGYIDTEPQIMARLMTFRALPVERRFGAELGTSAEGKLQVPRPVGGRAALGIPADIYATAADKLVFIRNSDGASIQVPEFGPTGPTTLYRWTQQALIDATAFFGASFVASIEVRDDIGGNEGYPWLHVAVSVGFNVESRAWFLGETFGIFMGTGALMAVYRARLNARESPTPWLFVDAGLDIVGRPEGWPASGFGIIEVDGLKEIVAWSEVDTDYDDQGLYSIRISQRELAGSPRVDPWAPGATITALSGHIGTIEEGLRTLITSSGTGARGSFDTLPAGFGLGFPDAWLDLSDYPANSVIAEALGEGGSSVEELLGGWLALWQMCLSQVESAGDVVIRAIPTTVMDGANIPTLTASDIVLGSVSSMGLIEGPNSLTIDAGVLGGGTEIKVRDVQRVQAEDWRTWELAAPGLSTTSSIGLALDLLRLSDGQQAIKVGVRPGFVAEMGSLLRVTAEHPEVYDWGTGATATSILVRVVGVERDIYTGERSLTLLAPGQASDIRPLCPAAAITARGSTTTATFLAADLTGFAVGSDVLIYVAGNATTYAVARTITDMVTTGADTVVTFGVAFSTGDYPAGSWMTYQDSGTDAEQDKHMYTDLGEFS